MNPAKLRVGVIGLGIGQKHLQGYRSHPRADVVAIVDSDPVRLKSIGDEYGIERRYASASAMFAAERLDIVSVVTPNSSHHDLTLEALRHGSHVLCEKPMAMNAAECRAMIAAARGAGRRLMINFSNRFKEQGLVLKRQVDTEILGDIYYARTLWLRRRGMPNFGSWFGQRALAGGGPLIDLGVHRLDLALWLMGFPEPDWVQGRIFDPIASVRARQENKPFDVEDFAVAMITFKNGAALTLEASWAGNMRENERMETALFGTKGGLRQRNLNESYQFETELYVEREGSQFDMQLHPPVLTPPGAMYHFVDAILKDEPHSASGEEGLKVTEILDAIYHSAATHQPVRMSGESHAASAAVTPLAASSLASPATMVRLQSVPAPARRKEPAAAKRKG